MLGGPDDDDDDADDDDGAADDDEDAGDDGGVGIVIVVVAASVADSNLPSDLLKSNAKQGASNRKCLYTAKRSVRVDVATTTHVCNNHICTRHVLPKTVRSGEHDLFMYTNRAKTFCKLRQIDQADD